VFQDARENLNDWRSGFVKTVGQIVDHLRAVGDKGGGIWYLDSKMGKRGKA